MDVKKQPFTGVLKKAVVRNFANSQEKTFEVPIFIQSQIVGFQLYLKKTPTAF